MQNHNTRAAFIMMIATLVSRLLGFVRVLLISIFFGGGAQADIINLVFSIPNNLRKLLAEGALSSAFIPVLTNLIAHNQQKEAHTLFQQILAFILCITGFIILISIRYTTSLLQILFSFSSQQMTQAIPLFQILIIYIMLVSFAAICMATLNSHHYFTHSAFAPLSVSLSVISALVLFHNTQGIMAIAIGIIVGGFLQIIIQLPPLIRLHYSCIPLFTHWNNTAFIRVLQLWIPGMLAALMPSIGQQVTMRFASELSTGSASALTNALVFWQLPFGIFCTSIVTALFPRITNAIHTNNNHELITTMQYGIRALITFMSLATVMLMLYSVPLITIALQHGAFTRAHTEITAHVLSYYSITLIPSALIILLQRLLYAQHRRHTLLISAIIAVIIDIVLAYYFKNIWGVTGLVLAHAITQWLLMISLGIYIFITSNITPGFSCFKHIGIIICICMLLIVIAYACQQLLILYNIYSPLLMIISGITMSACVTLFILYYGKVSGYEILIAKVTQQNTD